MWDPITPALSAGGMAPLLQELQGAWDAPGAQEDTRCLGRCQLQAVTSSPPQIDACEELCKEVSGFADTKVFGGWLQSDCRPFKQALLDAINRRGLALRQHLTSYVTTR